MSEIETRLENGVLTVTLNRPDKKNAITQAMYAALAEATERARTDDAVRVLLFRAEGDSFSAGNDIGDFIALGSQAAGPLDLSVFRFLKALADLDRPVVDLSVGQRRRLDLACALLAAPHVLLLDEPTNHLSIDLVDELTLALRRTPAAVVVATHDRRMREDLADWPTLHLG